LYLGLPLIDLKHLLFDELTGLQAAMAGQALAFFTSPVLDWHY
jgi:hypothetical protein